jgi:hypothetical protein
VGRSRCILQRFGQRREVLRAIWSSADTYTYSNCVTYSDIHCYTDWYSNGNINPEFDAASYSDAEISSKSAITPDSPTAHHTGAASTFAASYSSAATYSPSSPNATAHSIFATSYASAAAIGHNYNCIERGMIRRSCLVWTSSFTQECGRRVEATVPARKN